MQTLDRAIRTFEVREDEGSPLHADLRVGTVRDDDDILGPPGCEVYGRAHADDRRLSAAALNIDEMIRPAGPIEGTACEGTASPNAKSYGEHACMHSVVPGGKTRHQK